ncbi:4Fe-4S dicluster domain-containing protein [Carboxydothermus pertinax]|uniref:Heterodisulfide reductase n=1 Tax=Carboxydothermus pertinax TaxID=870242 RepID=A0A1L8CVU6_9THEO|nr:4Fe-4S dicluster domain-containing protein [Carboxydothermus pertinax]GAV23017.1 heterodisulfide reductase [Carboxydothermus pertinax]
MNVLNYTKLQDQKFIEELETESGQHLKDCYQCGKCTAGCPVAFAMDYTPNQVMHLSKLGLGEEVLRSRTIWICASCNTCTTRCPKNIDIARVMDSLRIMARRKGYTANSRNVAAFNRIFLDMVKNYGKSYELGLILNFNLKTGQPFKDVGLGPKMLALGKLAFFPSKVKNSREIKRIFETIEKLEGGN